MGTKVVAGLVFASFAALAQMGSYTGPSILSRGGGGTGRGGAHEGIRFYAGVYGDYETGLIPASVDSQGRIINPPALYGIGVQFGAYGTRAWRHTTLGLDYMGDVRHYNNAFYDGTDHMLGLRISTQVSHRLTVFSRTAAGTYSMYYPALPVFTAGLISTPGYNIFDNRTYYLETDAGVTYQLTNRLSFVADGTGFFVRYRAAQLVGVDGWGANGELRYRLNKTRTLLVDYGRVHFDYPRNFGETDMDNYMIGISQQLSRRWQVGVSVGASRLSTIGVEQIAADPVTAALFGVPITFRAFQDQIWIGAGQAAITGRFRHSSASLSVLQMPNGGNGVYLTSKSTSVNANYTYTGVRRASLYLYASYNSMSSVGQTQLGTYTFYSGGGGASYSLKTYLDANLNINTRNLQIDQTTGFGRLSYGITLGLNLHTGTFPIVMW